MQSLPENSAAKRAEITNPTALPQLVGLGVVGTAILTFFFNTLPLPIVPAFIPAVMTAVALLYLLTAFHLFRLYTLTGRLRLLLLGTTFALTGWLVVPYLLTFPGVLPGSSLSESATWFWLLWHLVFPFGIVVSLFSPDAEHIAGAAVERVRHLRVLTLFFLFPLSVFLFAFILIALTPSLPTLIVGNDFTFMHVRLEAPLLALDAAALTFAFFRARGGTALDRWLIVCLLFTLCDVQITLNSLHRYSLGWYVAHSLSLGTASVLLLALLNDFTRIYGNLALSHDALQRLARTDPLTRIGNRAHVLERVQEFLNSDTPFALAILDLDHFKAVNDTYGHLTGDDILLALASRVVRALKAQDLVGRLGGEEFLVVLPGLDLIQARNVTERVLRIVRASPFATRSGPVPLTASIGLAAALPGEPLDHLLARADAALYQAKREGRDRLVVAS